MDVFDIVGVGLEEVGQLKVVGWGKEEGVGEAMYRVRARDAPNHPNKHLQK